MIFRSEMTALAAAMLASTALTGCGGQTSDAGDGAPMTLAETGRAEFRACAVCHSVKDPKAPDYTHLIGPSLFGVYGAAAAHHDDFDYSPAMRAAELTWNEQTLDAFLTRPQNVVPGTRMAYVGETDAGKRAALIAYLKTLK